MLGSMPLPPDPFVEHIGELLSSYPEFRSKRMFGGHGIYVDDYFVALVAEGVLYLKVDDDNREAFEMAGMGPFIFRNKDGKETAMSYFQCPDEAFDRSETMRPWIDLALGASRRQEQRKNSKKK